MIHKPALAAHVHLILANLGSAACTTAARLPQHRFFSPAHNLRQLARQPAAHPSSAPDTLCLVAQPVHLVGAACTDTSTHRRQTGVRPAKRGPAAAERRLHAVAGCC